VYYGTQQQLEYDFVVAPHADASRIRLTLGGAKPIAAADGSLRLVSTKGSDSGDLTFQKPIIYQQINGVRRPVSGSFAIASNGDVSFRLGAYDHAQPLVIDPLISYRGPDILHNTARYIWGVRDRPDRWKQWPRCLCDKVFSRWQERTLDDVPQRQRR
jgi:hypothetical protein